MYTRIYGKSAPKGGTSKEPRDQPSDMSTGEDMLTLAKALILFKQKTKKRYGQKPKRESVEEREERMKKGKNKEPSPKKLKQKKKEKKNKPKKDLTDEERVAKPTANEEVTEEELNKDLHVTSTDFKVMQNAFLHYTSKYKCVTRKENKDLVVRRGFTFAMEITFDRHFDLKNNYLAIMMSTGPRPDMETGTFAMIEVTENGTRGNKQDPMTWWANIKKQDGKSIDLEIHIPADCVIGFWRMTICTTNPKNTTTSDNAMLMYEDPMYIIILFNAWCKDDAVYFPTTSLLNEYVLNQDGVQYTGSSNDWGLRPWRFGQFADGVLDICIGIITMAFQGQIGKKMGDPVKVTRKLSQIVNDCDDNGVLVGNWSGNYEGGKKPTSWTGSVKILQEYDQHNGRPVKFGQCWVFSGVTTTVCRALGIPAKSITNYSSAHDTDGTIHIDRFWEKEGSAYNMSKETSDSIWNFHVWNEVWMARRDLPEGYDGWQAIDSTPQELSDDVFCCGPSPLAAIKKGECFVKYDTKFIFSEINADVIDWELTDSGDKTKLSTNKHIVGIDMSTKTPDGKAYSGPLVRPDRDVETHCYKYPEGTEMNRKAVQEARKSVVNFHDDSDLPEMQLEMKVFDIDKIQLGNDFTVKVSLKSIAKDGKLTTIKELPFEVIAIKYTGHATETVKMEFFKDIVLQPGEEVVKEMKVTVLDYINAIHESSAMVVAAFAKVEETGRTQFLKDDFVITRPVMSVRGPLEIKEGESITLELSFTNPLPITLTGVQFDVESFEYKNVDNCKQPNIEPNKEWKTTVTLEAEPDCNPGESVIYANFESNEISDIMGSIKTRIIQK